MKNISILYYIILLIIFSDVEPNASIFRTIIGAGFMFVWSLFVGGIVAIVVFPFGSAFFAVSKKTKEAFIDNLFCIIVFIGLLSTLFIAYR